MKKLIALVLLFGISQGHAAETMTFGEVLKAKASEVKAVYSITWPNSDGDPRHAGGIYLPINTIQSADGKTDYMDWGVGAEEPQGDEKPKLIVPIMGNVIAITKKIFSFRWAKNHVRATSLPDLWLGPIWHPPVTLSKKGLKSYVFFHHVGAAASIRFSGPWFTKEAD